MGRQQTNSNSFDHHLTHASLPTGAYTHHNQNFIPNARKYCRARAAKQSNSPPLSAPNTIDPPHPSESSLIIRTWPQSVPATSLSSNCPQITSPHPHPLSQNRPKTKRYNRQAWDSPSPASEEASNGLVLAGLVHLRRVKADDISALVRHGGLLHRGARGGRLPSLEACPSPC